MPNTLADLRVGQRGSIFQLAGPVDVVQRLMEMGLTEGEEVEVVRFAPMGDPMEIRIQGYHLSLRREEARTVHVEGAK
jgi:ferrous iron transport protein A